MNIEIPLVINEETLDTTVFPLTSCMCIYYFHMFIIHYYFLSTPLFDR